MEKTSTPCKASRSPRVSSTKLKLEILKILMVLRISEATRASFGLQEADDGKDLLSLKSVDDSKDLYGADEVKGQNGLFGLSSLGSGPGLKESKGFSYPAQPHRQPAYPA